MNAVVTVSDFGARQPLLRRLRYEDNNVDIPYGFGCLVDDKKCIEVSDQSFGNALRRYDHQSRSDQNVHSKKIIVNIC
jgi:hypothetical protein